MAGCASSGPKAKAPEKFSRPHCEEIYRRAAPKPIEEKLNSISELYQEQCFEEVIALGRFTREQHRDKVYYFTTELAEVFTPEGSFTDYVMESYERAFLSVLLAMSHLRLDQEDAALVELRRSHDEEAALIYNYGTDPVLTALQASLWERLDPGQSRASWQKLSEYEGLEETIRGFARGRVQAIDKSLTPVPWKIYGLGDFPALEGKSDFLSQKQGLYKIEANTPFPEACATTDTLLISTRSWQRKISYRYNSGYLLI